MSMTSSITSQHGVKVLSLYSCLARFAGTPLPTQQQFAVNT